jgi:hypothetical protein
MRAAETAPAKAAGTHSVRATLGLVLTFPRRLSDDLVLHRRAMWCAAGVGPAAAAAPACVAAGLHQVRALRFPLQVAAAANSVASRNCHVGK